MTDPRQSRGSQGSMRPRSPAQPIANKVSRTNASPTSARAKKPAAPAPQPGLMRSIGQFFGHVMEGVRSGPDQAPEQQEMVDIRQEPIVRHEVIERVQETPSGPITIRRTIIEEVRLEQPGQG